MPSFIDISGQKFGRLTAVSIVKRGGKCIYWKCKCDCGKVVVLPALRFKYGNTRSCGCYRKEWMVNKFTKHGHAPASGASPEYGAWAGMKKRCTNPKTKFFRTYGGRGIKVCKKWINSFPNFLKDMGRKPSEKHSIERINNDGNYEPSNCRWAVDVEQCNNKRTNRFLKFRGEIHTVAQWSRILNIKRSTLSSRLNTSGWSIRRSLSTPGR